MYLLKCEGFLITFIWTALVFHHGHNVHKSAQLSEVRLYFYISISSRHRSKAGGFQDPRTSAGPVAPLLRSPSGCADSPRTARRWPCRLTPGLCTRYSN